MRRIPKDLYFPLTDARVICTGKFMKNIRADLTVITIRKHPLEIRQAHLKDWLRNWEVELGARKAGTAGVLYVALVTRIVEERGI